MSKSAILTGLIASSDVQWLNGTKTIFRLDYIESSWGEYIDTGIHATNTLVIKQKIRYIENGMWQRPCGAIGDFYGPIVYLDHFSWFWNGSVYTSAFSTTPDVDFEVVFGKIVYLNDAQVGINNDSVFETTDNLRLFSLSGYDFFKGRCYYSVISDGSSVIRNFLPAYNLSTNECGLYDTVHGVWYSNAGTGAFTGKLIKNGKCWSFYGPLNEENVTMQLSLLPNLYDFNTVVLPSSTSTFTYGALDPIRDSSKPYTISKVICNGGSAFVSSSYNAEQSSYRLEVD